MAEDARRETIWCDSSDRVTRLHGYIWWPEEGVVPVAAVQLVHGMAEHISRYDEFARYLNSKGFVVFGHDSVGHGESSTSDQDLGDLPADNGADILIEDVHRVRTDAMARVSEVYGQLPPLFLFGHSLGSLIVRVYLARHGYGLRGAILSGTNFQPPRTTALMGKLARTTVRTRGGSHHSKLLHKMGVGAYSQEIDDAKTDFDWLSHNADNVNRYIADPKCGFMFTAGGYVAVADLLHEACEPECVDAYPKDLPLLYISGTEDPVGEFGEGVSKSADLAHAGGVTDVRCRLYAGMRHEILNERGRQVVFDDIVSWMGGYLS